MATIRAYTTIEQSRKLAEFLPFESADMYYEPSAGFCTEPSEAKIGNIEYAHPRSIRCWSLAALLGVLPAETRLLKSTNISSVGDVKYYCDYPKDTVHEWYDNPVDACYGMIIKLHELNLL